MNFKVIRICRDLVERKRVVLDDVVVAVGKDQHWDDRWRSARLVIAILLAGGRLISGQLVLRYHEESPATLGTTATRIAYGSEVEVSDILVPGIADDLGGCRGQK